MVAAPSTVTASRIGTTNGIRVTWTSIAAATGYDVERQVGTGTWTRIATNRSLETLDDTGLTLGNSYRYRVRSRQLFRDPPSTDFSSFTNSNRVTLPVPVPDAPANVFLNAVSDLGSIRVTFSSSSFADSYDVQRRESSNAGVNWGTWSTVSNSTTDRDITYSGLTRGSTFQFRVRAKNSSGTSGYTTSGTLTLRPLRPGSVSASRSGETNIRVTWPAANGATGYDVDRSQDGGGFTRVTSNTSSRDITYENLPRGSTYVFRVRSKNSAGDSPTFRESDSVFIPFPPPSAPSSASISRNKRDVEISLGTATAPPGTTISSYQIEIRTAGGSYGSRRTVSTSDRRTVYNNLNPGTTYQGRGRAVGTGGEGPWRESGTVTLSPPPSAPSVSISRNVRDITAVSGVAPSASDVTISGYTYQIRSSTNGGVTWGAYGDTRTSNTVDRTATYTNLNPSTTYQVRARAESDFNSGAWGESNIITLPPPPAAPATVGVDRVRRSVTVTSAQSSVQDASVVISGYRFQRRESRNGGATWITDWGNDLTSGPINRVVTFTDLNPDSTYQFRARAESNFGPSAYRNSPTVLIPGLPDPPSQVIALQLGANALITVGAPAFDGGAPILTYTLQRRSSDDFGTTWSEWGDPVIIPGSTSIYLYQSLPLIKTYQFRALATNEEGNSESFTESNTIYLPAIVRIREGNEFRLPNDYKRYDESIGDWIGLSTYKRYFNGNWVDLT